MLSEKRADVDFTVLKANFGASSAAWELGDFDGDQRVNLADFTILKANFGASRAVAVPEPAGAWPMLLAVAALAGLMLRRHNAQRAAAD